LSDKHELEALINLASQKLENPRDDSKISDVYMFIVDRAIKAGSTPITPTHIYDEYCLWTNSPKSHSMFGREFKKYFINSKRTRKGNIYYMLDSSSFDMSEEAQIDRKNKLRERHMNLHHGKKSKKE
jgi:hypothetical protein